MVDTGLALLAEVTRGEVVESTHRGVVVVADVDGKVVASAGDPERPAYFRSSAKPYQAIPLIESGAADAFGFTEREVALACSSHDSTPDHQRGVTRMLEKAGLHDEDLRCGISLPVESDTFNSIGGFVFHELGRLPKGGDMVRAHGYSVRVEAVRDAVGDTVDISFDLHWRYNVSDAKRLAYELEPYGLMWLEDPVPPENIEAMRRVTQSTKTPISSGENYYMRFGFREALEKEALDIIAPDLQKVGGLLEGRRICDLADTHYVAVAPHCIASPVGTIASAHVAAAVPNFLALEWHGMSVPFWDEMVTGFDGPVIQDGFIKVPQAPGLGVELNEEVAREYALEGEPFFEE